MALKMIISMAVITCMALVLVITTNISNNNTNKSLEVDHDGLTTLEYSYLHAKQPAKKVSRFLVEKEKEKPNPRAADHCHKDDDICYDLLEGSKNATCCNNKCVDIATDKNHCGGCKSKCKKYTDDCCGGKCVNLAYDKRNCGSCGFKCKYGKYCIYGFCDYA